MCAVIVLALYIMNIYLTLPAKPSYSIIRDVNELNMKVFSYMPL